MFRRAITVNTQPHFLVFRPEFSNAFYDVFTVVFVVNPHLFPADITGFVDAVGVSFAAFDTDVVVF